MLKLLFGLICLNLLFYSCKRKESKKKYYWISYHKNYQIADTNEIFHIDTTLVGDTNIISYYSREDTIQYFLVTNKKDSSLIKGPFEKYGLIRPFFDTTIALNKNRIKLTKYVLNEFKIDGSSIHYFTPELGIFIIHSGTWPGIRYLQTSDTNINDEIDKLIKISVPRFFIQGKLKSMLKN